MRCSNGYRGNEAADRAVGEEDVSDGQGGYDSTLVSKGSTWAKVTNIPRQGVFLCCCRSSGKGCIICHPVPLGYNGNLEH
ncbi:MAG: hypothetical protein LKI17_02880 [Megasphaera cerevisiae]|jgi:hypothetical protein|nr:hypothetical protein [Megasphaera cerevisiae]